VNTPESDGIGRVTQLSILPGSSFLHEFVAVDTGTFWYHSHVQSQTAMGLMGAFVVHPKTTSGREEQGEFVLLLNDWQHFYTSEQHHLLIESSQFYPNDLESLTQSGTIDFFEAVDGSRAAEALVTSILINGRGQFIDTRDETKGFSTTPLEYLKIDSTRNNSTYRLRLINGGSVFSLKFSIDKHPLKVIASDGIPFAQPMIVDQLIIGLGERYDIIIGNLTTIDKTINYWIRVDTMDKNNNTRWHGLAILQYATTNEIPTSERQNCTTLQQCRILNCPFSQYGPRDTEQRTPFICLTPLNMSTHEDHLDHDLLSETIQINIKRTISLTMVEGQDDQSGFESFNYIGMKYPSMAEPILSNPRLARELLSCSNRSLDENSGEKCYHTIVAQYNDIIELLLINHDDDQHPLHLHGSYFHIVEQGLAELNTSTGEIIADNSNVECNEHAVCTCTQTNTMCTKNNMRLVKDTVQLPKGG
jgi:FtsP/CotA-like multicopper oxidase with cupredoxin domain